MKSTNKTLVVTPTYNERENIKDFITAVLKIESVDILIVDDSSPDKTAEIVKEMAKNDSRINLLVRSKKEGLGAAYKAGFAWGLTKKYDFFVSMDADMSHRPEDLPKLLAADNSCDVVIGSRYIPGGAIVGWGIDRQLNSRIANIVSRLMLGLKPKDVTAGFKRYTRTFITFTQNRSLISSGYAFQVEMILLAEQNGYKITEVPIVLVDRTKGQSKISGELKRSVRIVWQLFLKRKGVRQFIKFIIVGAINTIIDWTIFYLLKNPLSLHGQFGKQLAKAGSFVVSASSSYAMNRRWTFRSEDSRIMRQMSKFFLVAVVGLAINNGIFYIVTSPNVLDQRDFVGLIFGTGIVMFWNFTVNKYWTFS